MKKDYDFSKARRGAPLQGKGKTRITMYLDEDILAAFRDRAEQTGRGYQTLINDVLRQYLANAAKPVDAATLRRILREELKKVS
jgi:uncharacterized protein (DUF4415 family)